ncbi:MAG TPA: glycosyltransferase [Oculatellaceae cyanobacterium]
MNDKILMCISTTGGGHRSAAHAVKNAIDEIVSAPGSAYSPVESVIVDVVEQSSLVHRFYVHLYNWLLRHKQSWMKYYWQFIEFAKPYNSELGYWLAAKYAKQLIETLAPRVIVSLHPMANHYLARALEDARLTHKPRLIIVVTDPNSRSWTGWACAQADLTIVPNVLARQHLISLGVSPERILTIGMPVDPSFLHPPTKTRERFLQELGLAPDLVTICLTAGSAGGGNSAQIFDELLKLNRPFQVIVTCGNNQSLFRKICKKSVRAPFPVRVVRSFPSMEEVMNACDLLITKAGGLTVFEAIASRLPMALDLVTEPMPQEMGTADLLIAVRLAQPIWRPSDVRTIVESLTLAPPGRRSTPCSLYNLDRTDAAYDIAKAILCHCEKHQLHNTECAYCMRLEDNRQGLREAVEVS